MAAKKASSEGGARASESAAPEMLAASDAAKIMRQMAEDLRKHAELLDDFAGRQPALGNPSVNVLPGNFYLALSNIRAFMQSQIVTKIMNKAKPLAGSQAVILGEMLKQIGQLGESMPQGSDDE